MPKAGCKILKANPQDGTTPIPNLLLEAPAMVHLSRVIVEIMKCLVKENSKVHQVIAAYHLCLFNILFN